MTEALIKKLETLDASLRDLRKRYDSQKNELTNLKNKPVVEVSQLHTVKQQLTDSKQLQQQNLQEKQDLQEKLSKLDTDYQSLASAHHELNDKYSNLSKKYALLEQANKVLQDKNRTAAEHTKVVLERLTQIDQSTK